MMTGPKTASLIWMTNRSRAWLYEKTAKEFAKSLYLLSYTEKFIDTSQIEYLLEAEILLSNYLSQINKRSERTAVIVIKDTKWKPNADEIYKILDKFPLYIAEVDLQVVEQFTESMNPQGLIEYILLALKPDRE